MRRHSLVALSCIFSLSACGSGTAIDEPEAPSTAATTDWERLDRLWSDVAAARVELKVAETGLIIDCLEAEGFTVHNIQDMTRNWRYIGPPPSAMVASIATPTGLPTPAEAEERALGVWLDFADAYDDEAGIALRDEKYESEPEEEEPQMVEVDLSALDALGEGWESRPAVDQMKWEIAYQGSEWAAVSKAASLLTAEEREALGSSAGEWGESDTVSSTPPQGCMGEVLTGLYGEPQGVDNGVSGFQWVWGPLPETTPEMLQPIDLGGIPEAADFLTCLAAAGHGDLALSDFGGLDHEHWRRQYLPEAAVQSEGVTEYSHSDVTDADRARYEQVKAAEFEAAAAVADCDRSSGYTAAAAAEYERQLTARLLESEATQQTYLADLENALAAL